MRLSYPSTYSPRNSLKLEHSTRLINWLTVRVHELTGRVEILSAWYGHIKLLLWLSRCLSGWLLRHVCCRRLLTIRWCIFIWHIFTLYPFYAINSMQVALDTYCASNPCMLRSRD